MAGAEAGMVTTDGIHGVDRLACSVVRAHAASPVLKAIHGLYASA
jgi:hypothetical protein